jgi:hypothetical protein
MKPGINMRRYIFVIITIVGLLASGSPSMKLTSTAQAKLIRAKKK